MQNQISSSEESDVQEMASKKTSFRVRVCLKQYYSDIRSRCFVLVSRTKRVRWLEQRLRKLFCIEGPFYLSSCGHLLPSSEPLALLNPDDQVEVIPRELSQDAPDAAHTNCTDLNLNINNNTFVEDSLDISVTKSSSLNQYVKSFETSNLKNKRICFDEQNSEEAIDAGQSEMHTVKGKDAEDINSILNECEILQDMKQKTLLLLEEKLGDAKNVSNVEPGNSRQMRKRVRKRKRAHTNTTEKSVTAAFSLISSDIPGNFPISPSIKPTSTNFSPFPEATNDIISLDKMDSGPHKTSISDGVHVAQLVAQNNAIEPRKARIIYALED